jgi:DNA-binding NtrC family response regulator
MNSSSRGAKIRIVPEPAAEGGGSSGPAEEQTVLVVDDDDSIRDVIAMMLDHSGYKSVQVTDGASAVEVCRRSAEVNLVIMDMNMPDVSGADCLDDLWTRRADLPVVMTSGEPLEDRLDDIHLARLSGFLQKPFTIDDLVATVRTALNTETDPDD